MTLPITGSRERGMAYPPSRLAVVDGSESILGHSPFGFVRMLMAR
jgi:hypothetical protein